MRSFQVIAPLASVPLLAVATAPAAPTPPTAPRHVASLLRRRWNWKTASAESVTEWAIVLRRYHLVSMDLSNLLTQLIFLLPVNPVTGDAQPGMAGGGAERAHAKVEKICQNVVAGMRDQNVSDATFRTMEADKALRTSQQRALLAEHAEKQRQASGLADLGWSACLRARAILDATAKGRTSPASAPPKGTEQKYHAAGSMLPPVAQGSDPMALYRQLSELGETLAAKLAACKRGEEASAARLLAVQRRLSKVFLRPFADCQGPTSEGGLCP